MEMFQKTQDLKSNLSRNLLGKIDIEKKKKNEER